MPGSKYGTILYGRGSGTVPRPVDTALSFLCPDAHGL